jgi:hypothetical protein
MEYQQQKPSPLPVPITAYTYGQQPSPGPSYTYGQQPSPGPSYTYGQQPSPGQQSLNMPENINNLYIDIQDYLDTIMLLVDKTKDTFISVNTILENMKPYIYKKVEKNM